MSIGTSAYLIYGVQITRTHAEDLEDALKDNTVGVSYLHAGPYDQDNTYLTTAFYEAELRGNEALDLGALYADGDPAGKWNSALAHAVEKVGRGQLTQPGWILIAAQS